MGHYHRIINLTQHAQIVPMDVGVLDKLLEFGPSPGSAMAALWLLLGREAWCGDRIAILGYEGRPDDLSADVVAETGLDGTAFYAETLSNAGRLARSVLTERGICRFAEDTCSDDVTWWHWEPAPHVAPAGVDVVAADLDRREVLDRAEFGDSRDLHVAAWRGGYGGVTTALTFVLAASNRGGSRGGGDFRSCHPLLGAWAGDRLALLPLRSAAGFTDVSAAVRHELEAIGEGRYVVAEGSVSRQVPW